MAFRFSILAVTRKVIHQSNASLQFRVWWVFFDFKFGLLVQAQALLNLSVNA
ncbi:hypothetical protein PPHE_b0613 [Pseudoalteromonas phenolica O-BC30]|nr:hypothetical protein [Pseudoalteromonas phenolica O-BC30]